VTYIELDPQLEAKVRMDEKLTGEELVLVMLRDAGTRGVCGTTFLKAYQPRYSARLHALRKRGWNIQRRRCDRHDWHDTAQYVWELLPPEHQGSTGSLW
jgi:hypothetical protein